MKKKVKNNVNRKKIVIAIIFFIATIYILYVAILLVGNKKDTIFVEQGTIHKEETVVGYIIRNETVLRSEEHKKGILQIAGEGERVSKSEAIFQYNNNETEELIDKINSVTRENLTGIRVVRAFNAEDYQEEKFDNVNTKLIIKQ